MKRAVFLSLVLMCIATGLYATEKFKTLPDAPDYETATQQEVETYIVNKAFEEYFYLLSFKSDPDFLAVGLIDPKSPYYGWRTENLDLIKYALLAASQNKIDTQERKNVIYRLPEILRDLGSAYSRTKGQETEETLSIKDGLGGVYGKTKYRKPVKPTPVRF